MPMTGNHRVQRASTGRQRSVRAESHMMFTRPGPAA